MKSTILIIDDERPTLEMLEMLLEAYGYEVLTAESGEEGVEVFELKHPPLVMTDIKMPGMDGMEVLKRIKKINPQTEVIVVTGHGDMDLAIEALNLDATDFINKPVQRQAMDQALKRAEERIRLSRDKEDEIRVDFDGNCAIIAIQGNVTSLSEPYITAAYREAWEAGSKRIILFFNDNASINGAGIAVLTQLLLDSREQGRDVVIAGLSDNFRKVFEIVGITRLAVMYDSVRDALADKCST